MFHAGGAGGGTGPFEILAGPGPVVVVWVDVWGLEFGDRVAGVGGEEAFGLQI